MRKIVQIAARAEGEATAAMLFALCDDGTLWAMWVDGGGWKKVVSIPQDQPPAKDAG